MGKQWKTAGKQLQASKKGALFTKLSRAIQVATRLGGSNPDNNHRLKLALDTARSHSLPKDTIARAIERGSGSTKDNIEEMMYEGFGPCGVAVLVHCLTDNRVRTVSEIRHIFKSQGGNMGDSGSVLWMFNHVAMIQAHLDKAVDESIEEVAINVGAEDIDIIHENKQAWFYGDKSSLNSIQEALTKKGWIVDKSQWAYRAKTWLKVSDDDKKTIEDFLSLFADNPDCQNVYSNLPVQQDQ